MIDRPIAAYSFDVNLKRDLFVGGVAKDGRIVDMSFAWQNLLWATKQP